MSERADALLKRWRARSNALFEEEGYFGPRRIEAMVDCIPWGFPFQSEEKMKYSCWSRFCPWCWCKNVLKPRIAGFKKIGWAKPLGDYRLVLTVHSQFYEYQQSYEYKSHEVYHSIVGPPSGLEEKQARRHGLYRSRCNLRERAERAGSVGGATLFTVAPHNWGTETPILFDPSPPGLVLTVRQLDLLPPGDKEPSLRLLPLGNFLRQPQRMLRRRTTLRRRKAVARLLGSWAAYPAGRMFGPPAEALFLEGLLPRHRVAAYGLVKFPGRKARITEDA